MKVQKINLTSFSLVRETSTSSVWAGWHAQGLKTLRAMLTALSEHAGFLFRNDPEKTQEHACSEPQSTNCGLGHDDLRWSRGF
ncbi:hypothetical protein A6X21_17120 [Planctopirus hydrillae]|uniref:Uncharacterized protein n=1 Tax=Planctopirus hydrillae TaxID=1841610 RepID=A0A1C3EQK3_9PLAN|nr:hypothetical protein A6X21_17120 [Planctopirus hydrillae]